ncbi:MAG: TFIIB-type zinc ribbon-containing protein [Candidatus Bathyarchaeia archaeon]
MEAFVSLDFLRSRLPADLLEELASFLGLCLECGGCLRRVDGEVICIKCGRVWGYENVDESVPFPEGEDDGADSHFEGHWQPGSSLCFLKGLGDPVLENNGGKGLMRVLALAPNGGEDLGLRARRIKIIAQMEDPPQLRRILSRISHLLDRLGFRGNYEIAAYTGNLARKIVAFALAARLKVPTGWADAIVKYAFNKLQLNVGLQNQVLSVKDEDLHFVEWFEDATQKLKLKEVKPSSE